MAFSDKDYEENYNCFGDRKGSDQVYVTVVFTHERVQHYMFETQQRQD